MYVYIQCMYGFLIKAHYTICAKLQILAFLSIAIIIPGPPFFLTLSQSPIYIPQYVNKYIACVAGGDPYPSTSWRRINGTLPPNSAPNFDGLYLLSMEGSDVSGVYVCTASNVNGMIEVFFEVIYLSSITEAPTSATTATIATAEYGIYMYNTTCCLYIHVHSWDGMWNTILCTCKYNNIVDGKHRDPLKLFV